MRQHMHYYESEREEHIANLYQEIIDCDMQIQQLEYREIETNHNFEETEWRIRQLQLMRESLTQELMRSEN